MVVVLRVPGLYCFLWKLGHTVRERKKIVVIKHFQVIGLVVRSWGFPSGLLSFIYKMP